MLQYLATGHPPANLVAEIVSFFPAKIMILPIFFAQNEKIREDEKYYHTNRLPLNGKTDAESI